MRGILMNTAVAGLYGLAILPARAVGLVLGRDALRLRRPRGAASYWVEKAPAGGLESYFSQGPGPSPRGTTRLVLPLFHALARLAAPKRTGPAETATSAAQREQGIPDEIYTLW
jgi:hypothetical protein